MADVGLKIVVGADISKGITGLNDVNKALSNTAKASAEATAAFGKVGAGTSQATNALTNLSRVAQDAPFGFIGIQNNLNPLLESFGRLKQETGSSGAALKSLGAALAGPAGVGLALGVVSSLITVIIQKYGSLGNAIDALTNSTSTAAQAQRDISSAFAKAEGSVAGEIASINVLLSVARNETLSKQARAEAINKLNNEYDAYLPKLTEENINTQAVTESVDKLTKALVRQAKIKGLQELISKETAKQAELFAKSLGENADFIDNIIAGVKSLRIGGNFFTEQSLAGAKTIGKEYQDAQKKIEKFDDFLRQLTTEDAVAGTLFDEGKIKKGEDTLKRQLDAITKIRDAVKEFQGKLFDLKDIEEATNKLASLEQQVGNLKLQIAVRDAQKAKLPAAEIEKLKDAIKQDTQKRINEAFEKEALLLEFPKLKFSQVNRAEIPGGIDSVVAKATGLDKRIPEITLHEVRVKILGSKLTAEIEGKEEILEELSRQVREIFKGGLNDVFSGIGESLGEALAGNDFGSGLKKVAENILGVVGNVMQQLGKAIISAAIKIKFLKAVLEKFTLSNPGLAILAGIGLVAAGAALKNIKFDGPKFADGGIVSGPMIGQVGERFRPEVIIPLDRLPQLFKQFGGDVNGGTQLIPIINNEGLYLAMKRGERSAGRKF